MCSPGDFDCESPCMLTGETHSCRHRVQWSVGEGSTVIDALDIVSHECSGQCACSAADFGVQENVSTTAMLTTSAVDADQTISTTPLQSDISEPEQGDEPTTSEVDAERTSPTTTMQNDFSEVDVDRQSQTTTKQNGFP